MMLPTELFNDAPLLRHISTETSPLPATDYTRIFNATLMMSLSSIETSHSVTTGPGLSDTNSVIEGVIAKGIHLYFPPILSFTGVICNILVVMVMQSNYFRHMSTSFYMSVSAVVDNISLAVSLPAHYLYVNFPEVYDPVRNAHVMCSFFNLFGWGSSDMGVLLTVAMTTDRSLAIKFPLKASSLCTVRRAKIVTAGLFGLEFLKVGHLIVTSRVVGQNLTSVLCDVDLSNPSYAIFYNQYWPYIHNLFLVFSFIAIVIGNVIITVHVRRSEDTTMGIAGQKSVRNQAKMASKTRQLSLMLIIDSATVVVCTLPFSIYLVLDQSLQLFEDTAVGAGRKDLLFAVTFYLLYVNRCVNFFLYCVSGSRFRLALKDIVHLRGRGSGVTKQQDRDEMNTKYDASSDSVFRGDTETDRVSMSTIGDSKSYTLNTCGTSGYT